MNGFSNFMGIDVSKDKINVFFTETSSGFTVPNNDRAMAKVFRKVDPGCTLAVLEGTGGYEKVCVKTLAAMNIAIHRANNNQAKAFKEEEGVEDKSDPIDAEYLALYGQQKCLKLCRQEKSSTPAGQKKFRKLKEKFRIHEPASEMQDKIRQFTFRIQSLKAIRVKEKNRLQSPGCDRMTESCRKTIDFLNEEIDLLEKQVLELIKSDEDLSRRFGLLRQYVGIGDVTAICLLVHLPELGKIRPRALTALAGLAPKLNESGKRLGYRTTKRRGRVPW
jgi:transposase